MSGTRALPDLAEFRHLCWLKPSLERALTVRLEAAPFQSLLRFLEIANGHEWNSCPFPDPGPALL